ncbi:haloalkane dehalogenase [Rhizobium sp. LjRoot254]|uniref:haloalkane dehalogenase n=1 Tax=Rhizobium sp. LjRoot254 TaxID=3342297 RepID=UPI003ED16444
MPVTKVLDSTIFHEERGEGPIYVFLHGNPTSSYVWRNVLPALSDAGRLLAPDLIGMGKSGKPAIAYTFDDQTRYFAAWMEALGLDDVVLVGFDWGGALAMDWAARNSGRVRGLVLMETIIRPYRWTDMPAGARPRYDVLRGAGTGEAKVLDENFFIEQALRATTLNGLSDADLDIYREPYPTRESRIPLLQWPRAMPIEGEPRDVVERVEAYDRWLAASHDVPKLLLTFDGSPETLLIGPDMVAWCRANIAVLDVVGCGPAKHLVPEDQPEAIAAAIFDWSIRHRLDAHPAHAAMRNQHG